MSIRIVAIAVAALALPAMVAAEPTQLTASDGSTASPPRDIAVLASADHVASPGASGDDNAAAASTPAKRPRAARVTTCRCADAPAPSAGE
jgi:hypothetical protein